MAYIIFFLGVMVTGCGGYALYSGFDDLTTERGLALTLSGTIGVSIGLVVVAISFGLWHLSRIGRKLDDLKAATNDLATEISQALALPKETESQVLSAIEEAVFAEALQPPANIARDVSRNETMSGDGSAQDPMLETVLGLEDTYGRRPLREPLERPVVFAPGDSAGDAKVDGVSAPRTGGLSSLGRVSAGVAAAGIASAGAAAAATLAENDEAVASETKADAPDHLAKSPPKRDFMESEADINRLIEELSISDMAGSAHPDTVNPDFAKIDNSASVAGDTIDAGREPPQTSFDATLLEELGRPTPASTPEHPILELKSDHPVEEAEVEDAPAGASLAAPTVENEVIGSYESAGVTYTLYADGSVVAESGQMRESYPSLEALRAAFERGESVFSV